METKLLIKFSNDLEDAFNQYFNQVDNEKFDPYQALLSLKLKLSALILDAYKGGVEANERN